MFKVIYDGKVIDLLQNVIYLRFLVSSNKFVATDSTSAHAFYGSDKKTIYLIEGVATPSINRELKTAKIIKIGQTEFVRLQDQLQFSEITDSYSRLVEQQESKIKELSDSCSLAIKEGIQVRLSDNKLHHFRLTIEDQLNLFAIQQDVLRGARKVLYHETGKVVREFVSTDVERIIHSANKHKQYHTTYFNILKHYVLSCTNIEDIETIYYGIPLKELHLSNDLYRVAKENHIG